MGLMAQKSFQPAIITLNGSCLLCPFGSKTENDKTKQKNPSSQDKHKPNTHQKAVAHHRMSG